MANCRNFDEEPVDIAVDRGLKYDILVDYEG